MRSRTVFASTLAALTLAGCGSKDSPPPPPASCPGCTTIFTSATMKPYLVWLLNGAGDPTVVFAATDSSTVQPNVLHTMSVGGPASFKRAELQGRVAAVAGDASYLYCAAGFQLASVDGMGAVSQLAPDGMALYTDVVSDGSGNVAFGLGVGGLFQTRVGSSIQTLSSAAGTAALATSPVDGSLYWATVTGQLIRFGTGMGGWSSTNGTVALGSWTTARIAAGANGVYILDLGNGQLLRAPTAASMMPPTPTLLDTCEDPVGLAVDEPTLGTTGTIYYTCRGAGAGHGVVKRIQTDGTGKGTIATDQSSPAGVATGGGSVFWADYVDGTIVKAPL